MAELILTTADGRVVSHVLGNQAILGRHPECDIILADPMASRRHCRVEQVANGSYVVEDLGSANGTVLNGQPLRTRQPYRSNDTIQIGMTRLVLRMEAGPSEMGMGTHGFDPNLSIVRLKEDKQEQAPNIDYAMAAGGDALTAEEQASSDLDQLKRVTQRLKLMLDVGQAMGSTLDPRIVLQTCLDKLFDVFHQAERGFVLLYGDDGELPSEVASTDVLAGPDEKDSLTGRRGPLSVSKIRNPGKGEENEVNISKTVVNRVRSQRQSVLLSDTSQDGEFSPALSMARLEIRSVMCVPLIAATEDLGILYLDTKDPQHRFNPEDLDILTSLAGQVAVVIKNAALAREAAAEAATRENLQRFLSPDLADKIAKKEISFELGGTKKHGTVFFSDIVGFTRMAGQMLPADVVNLLNRYFRVMQEIIFSRSGTVDKFNGDQIMAFWGVLVDVPFAEAAAATSALEMQNAMFVLNRELAADDAIVKPPTPLGQGIGLNTGDFVAGNIGSERKIEFTVIGDAVNLAQRVESIAGRGQVFIGHGTYEAIKERSFAIRMPDCPVKNVPEPLRVYSLRGIVAPGQGAARKGVAGVAYSGETSRLEPNTEEMTFSLGCFLERDDHARMPGVVTRMVISGGDRRAKIQVLTDEPLPVGSVLRLVWDLHEKPSLQPFSVEVMRSWTKNQEDTDTSTKEMPATAFPTPLPGTVEAPPTLSERPSPVARKEKNTLVEVRTGQGAAGDAQIPQGTMILRAINVPEELLQFRPGETMQTDLTSPDQIIRA